MDYKGIGLAAKDIVMGIAGAAAGASGGAAGAEAVNKIDKGLDKAIAMADQGGSRADRADRADKPPKPKGAAAAAPGVTQPTTVPAASASEVASANTAWPPTGESRQTADHLASLGYSVERIRTILAGPQGSPLGTTVADVTQDRPKGWAKPETEGTRVASARGGSVPAAAGTSVPAVDAANSGHVSGIAAADAANVKATTGRVVQAVASRRIEKGGADSA